MTSLSERLAQLVKIRAAPTPVVSVYLDTQWRDERQRDRVRLYLAGEIRKAFEAAADPGLEDLLRWVDTETKLLIDLAVARGDGSYTRLLAKLAKTALLVLDDWGLAPLTGPQRHDVFEVLEDRTERASTLLTTQLPLKAWHEAIGDPTLADAICDRLVHTAHVLDLQGPSMRDPAVRTRGATGPPPSETGPTEGPDPPPPKPPGSRKRA